LVLFFGCGVEREIPLTAMLKTQAPATANIVTIQPGPEAAKKAQEALIKVKPGDVVEFGEGTFEFRSTLSLDVNDITIKGKGANKTILSFKDQGQGTGGEGILVTSKSKFTLSDIAIIDAKGDAIKVNGTDMVKFQNVAVSWSGGSNPSNGGYGIYPVQCSNVLIEGCTVKGASDAGIYVGQSKNIIVRRNKVEENVAGIEIENSIDADVWGNTATNNTGGILVFTLPDLPKKEGKNCRVIQNEVIGNNHENFAPKGNIVASVPPGTGVMIMANDDVEVLDNTIEKNNTAGVSVVSYLITQKPIKDPAYNPYCQGISIHNNRFKDNGTDPKGSLASVILLVLGKPFPDVLYDGMTEPKSKAVALSVRDNGNATFANFDARALDPAKMLTGKKPKIVRDLKEYASEISVLPAIKIEGVPWN
jgi:parallel beta-helix repeat protein